MLDNRGQTTINQGTVAMILAMVVIAVIGVFLANELYVASHDSSKGEREITYENTTDYTFAGAENTEETIEWDNRWENLNDTNNPGETTIDVGIVALDNVVIWCTDNEPGGDANKYDNGVIWDNVNLENTGVRDGISQVKIELKYWLAENDLMNTVALDVKLCDGTENRTIVHIDNLENATGYTALENDITDLLGWSNLKYTLYIQVGFDQDGSDTAENTIPARGAVYIDDARLRITTFDKGYGEEGVIAVGEKLPTVLGLAVILVMVFVAAIALKYLGAI